MDKQILDKVFLAYDIRGLENTELNEEFYSTLGKALVKFWNAKLIAVGRDIRKTSEKFFQSLVEGITSQGCGVIDMGEAITEIGYFAAGSNSELDGAVIITSSHNPKVYNGAKLIGKNASLVAGNSGFPEIKELMLKGNFPDSPTKGEISKKDFREEFKKKVLSFIDIEKIKDLNIVVDAGNALGGVFFDYVFGELPINVTKMYFEPDGNFPNHMPNPAEEQNIKEIKDKAVELNVDFGVAYDGDADRSAFIDSKGRAPSGYYTGPILASHIIKGTNLERPKIIHDARLARASREKIIEAGGTAVITRSGRSFLREAMEKHDALFGFETTSHMYYKDFWYWDSGMITTALMMEKIAESGKKLAELCDEYYEKYPTSGEINFEVADPAPIFEIVKEKFKDGELDETDGVSIEYKDWRFNLRKSNTQPVIRLNVEGDSVQIVVEKTDLLKTILGEEFSHAGN